MLGKAPAVVLDRFRLHPWKPEPPRTLGPQPIRRSKTSLRSSKQVQCRTMPFARIAHFSCKPFEGRGFLHRKSYRRRDGFCRVTNFGTRDCLIIITCGQHARRRTPHKPPTSISDELASKGLCGGKKRGKMPTFSGNAVNRVQTGLSVHCADSDHEIAPEVYPGGQLGLQEEPGLFTTETTETTERSQRRSNGNPGAKGVARRVWVAVSSGLLCLPSLPFLRDLCDLRGE